MRILIYNWRDWMHPWAGGAELHVKYQCEEFTKQGHSVIFYTARATGQSRQETFGNATIVRYGGRFSTYLLAPFVYWLKLQKKCDVIIDTHNAIPFFTPLFSGRPIVLLVHHISPPHQFAQEFSYPWMARVGLFLQNRFMPWVYRKNRLIAVSQSTKEEMLKIGFDEKKIDIVYNGVDHTLYKPGGVKTSEPSIVYVGRLKKYKRLELLLEAFVTLQKKLPGAALTIAGSGDQEQHLRSLAESKKITGAQFLGFVNDATKVDLLQRSWVFATPTSVEGWGLVVLEAAACGTPTVGFNVAGIREAIVPGKSGLLVPENGDFAQTLLRILQDETLRQTLASGALAHSENFSWSAMTQKELDLLEKVRV